MSDDPTVTLKELLDEMVEGIMEALEEQDAMIEAQNVVISRLDQRLRALEGQAGDPVRLRLVPSATVGDVGHG